MTVPISWRVQDIPLELLVLLLSLKGSGDGSNSAAQTSSSASGSNEKAPQPGHVEVQIIRSAQVSQLGLVVYDEQNDAKALLDPMDVYGHLVQLPSSQLVTGSEKALNMAVAMRYMSSRTKSDFQLILKAFLQYMSMRVKEKFPKNAQAAKLGENTSVC